MMVSYLLVVAGVEAETHDVRCDFVREARTREYFLKHGHEARRVRLFVRGPGARRPDLCYVLRPRLSGVPHTNARRMDLRDNHIRGELGLRLLCFNRGLRSLWIEGNPIDRPRALVVGVAPQVLFLDGDHLAPGALGIKERKVFESPPEPRARMAVIRDSLSPVDAASAFASAAAQRASRRSRREPNTPLSRGMSEPERGV